MQTTENLTASDVFALHTVLSAASQVAKVRYLAPAMDGQVIVEGTARHIVKSPDDYGFLRSDEDVRDGYLRVTSSLTGMDLFISVREAMELVKIGGFAIDS